MPPSFRGLLLAVFLLNIVVPFGPVSSTQGQQPAKTDAFGDPLPAGAVARMGSIRFRDGLRGMAFGPEGKTLTTGTGRSLRFWDARTGKLVREVPVASWGQVHASPDGKLLATSSDSGIHLLDPTTLRLLRTIKVEEEVLAFSPDSSLLATGNYKGEVSLWGPRTATLVRHLPPRVEKDTGGGNDAVGQFTPDGTAFIAVSLEGKHIRRWNVQTGASLGALETSWPRRKTIQISPDAQTLAVAPYATGVVSLWDTSTGKERCRLEGTASPRDKRVLAFTRDSRTLITPAPDPERGQTVLTLWDVRTGKARRRLTLPALVKDVYLAPDDRTLLTRRGATHILWDLATGQRLAGCTGHDWEIWSLGFTHDGKRLLSGSSDRTLRVWDAATGKEERILTRSDLPINTFAIAADDRTVLSGGGALVLFEIATGKELRRLQSAEGAFRPALRFGMTPDGRSAISFGYNEPNYWLHVWDLATGKVTMRRKEKPSAAGTTFSPDGEWSASGSDTSAVVVREIATGRTRLTLPVPDTHDANYAFSADGRMLANVSYRQPPGTGFRRWQSTLYLWELASGKECLRVKVPNQPDWIVTYQIALSADGRTIAATRESTLQVWDVPSGKELLRRTNFDSRPFQIAFAPDSKRVATGHVDGSILVWDLSPQLANRPALPKADAGSIERWWTSLAGDDATRAQQAVWALVGAPGHTLPLIRKRVQPAAGPGADKLRQLIADLADDTFARRQAASRELAELNELAEPAMREALKKGPPLEQRRRLERLLAAHSGGASGERLRSLRALRVLELIGTAEARQVVAKLAKGAPGARLTREAKATLKRLERRTGLK
jgi:WD40 repeat protein